LRYRASTVFTWRCVSFPSLQSIASSGVADASKYRNQSDRGRHIEQGGYRDLTSYWGQIVRSMLYIEIKGGVGPIDENFDMPQRTLIDLVSEVSTERYHRSRIVV
jgi:hypothetical protein